MSDTVPISIAAYCAGLPRAKAVYIASEAQTARTSPKR